MAAFGSAFAGSLRTCIGESLGSVHVRTSGEFAEELQIDVPGAGRATVSMAQSAK